MSRKKRDFSRVVLPDPKFRDVTVAKMVNTIMRSGKKGVAEAALYEALDQVSAKLKEEPIVLFGKAISNVRPSVEVRSRRVGGATYQVPTEVRESRAVALAMRWLVQAASERGERSLAERLANELMDACAGRGGAVKVREDTHRMAEANRAFAHFKW